MKTVIHANTDPLRSRVTEKLEGVPYLGGVYDVFDELPPDIILDHIDSLICDLK